MKRPNGNEETKEEIRRLALVNAIEHEGKAQAKPVLGKFLGENPGFRKRVGEIASLVEEVVQEVNSFPLDEQVETVKRRWPKLLAKEKEKPEEKKGLPPLPNAEKYRQVVTRFAPNPDAVLHLGSARAVILSHEYARMYKGRFVLRFEDTDPRLKKSALKFFDLIRKDLEWLGCKWDAEYIQSDRIEIYYEHAENLLNSGHAYICTCKREEFRNKVLRSSPCPCRSLKPEENLARWKAMLSGDYGEGEAVMRVKTDLNHPNPAIRDWPAFRIIDPEKYPHPRVGSKYRVWPLFVFANGVDDHLNGVTHVIRGKEHLTNQRRQEYLYHYLGWKYPEGIHYGRLKIVGATLSKSKILQGVQDGTYEGWDDPRLATFMALKRRGIRPEAIRHLILDIGPRPVDITLSWKNLYAYNRKIIDPAADRFFFISDPRELVVKDVPKEFTAQIAFHPDHPERGHRTLVVKPERNEARLLVSSKDAALLKERSVARLMELFNFQIEAIKESQITARFLSESYEEARRLNAPLIHWLPGEGGVPCEVVMPDGTSVKGLAEDGFRRASPGQVVQFERFGFVRIDQMKDKILVFFTHK
ncbi:MAG: glutamate--tRNA ligase [Candidatus Bathyarchaeota archaeon]|nr:glutamate--tRNA ligase [Candidatus Bathyarchaeota archaeon]